MKLKSISLRDEVDMRLSHMGIKFFLRECIYIIRIGKKEICNVIE